MVLNVIEIMEETLINSSNHGHGNSEKFTQRVSERPKNF